MSLQVFAIIAQLCLTPNAKISIGDVRELQADCQIKMTKCMVATRKKYSVFPDTLNEVADSKAMTDCIVEGSTK